MHVKEIYVIFILLFDSGILLIIDLNKKKVKKGVGG
jgi:presenilin-like A22 family membrane protease